MKDDINNTFLLGIFMILMGIILSTTNPSSEPTVDAALHKDNMFNKWKRIF